MFLDHAKKIIFDLNEPRTLQGLLLDYKAMFADYGKSVGNMKTSFIKKLLEDEFNQELQVGFHARPHTNESTLIFDASQGGNFLEAAINSWGIPLDKLVKNVAQRIRVYEKERTPAYKWPPTIEEMEDEMETTNTLTKLVGWLKSPNKKEPELSPKIPYIASALESLVCGKRTIKQTQHRQALSTD